MTFLGLVAGVGCNLPLKWFGFDRLLVIVYAGGKLRRTIHRSSTGEQSNMANELSKEDLEAINERITEFENKLNSEIKSMQEDSGDAQRVASSGQLKKGLDEARKARA